jgi:hypothetical protein
VVSGRVQEMFRTLGAKGSSVRLETVLEAHKSHDSQYHGTTCACAPAGARACVRVCVCVCVRACARVCV